MKRVALVLPFGNLVHFRKEIAVRQPRVLIVAPMAGHFPPCCVRQPRPCWRIMTFTSRTGKAPATCRCQTDDSGTDEYIDYLIRFFEEIGPGARCPGGVPALRRRAGGGGRNGDGEASGDAALHDADGGPGRYPHQSHQGQ